MQRGTESTHFYLTDCIIVQKKGEKQYGTNYITVGIPVAVYDRIASKCAEHGYTLDKDQRVTRDSGHYYVNVNIRDGSTEVLVKMYTVEDNGDVEECDLPAISDVLATVKSSILATLVCNVRLKKQAPAAEIESVPYTLGMTFKQITVRGIVDVVDEDMRLTPDEVKS